MEPTPPLTLRPATDADQAAVLACLRAAFAPYEARYTPAAFQATVLDPERFRARLAAMRIELALSPGDRLLGTLAWQDRGGGEGHLRGLAVLPEAQGRGVAGALLQAAEADLWSRGCARITLRTTHLLLRALTFYARHGYRPTGRRFAWEGMEVLELEKPRPN